MTLLAIHLSHIPVETRIVSEIQIIEDMPCPLVVHDLIPTVIILIKQYTQHRPNTATV